MMDQVLPDDVLEIIFDHLIPVQPQGGCLAKLSSDPWALKALRPLGWNTEVYNDYEWQGVVRNKGAAPTGLFAFSCLSRHWRRRALAVIMQRISINDSFLGEEEGDMEPLIKRLSATAALADGLSALQHVKHLTYGCERDFTQVDWISDIESHPWLTSKEDQSGEQWSLEEEIELGASFFSLLPTTVRSLWWGSPLPIEGKIAEKLVKIQFEDVLISTVAYCVAPRNLKVFKYARRLRLDTSAGGTSDPKDTDNFYEDRNDPSSRNLLAEYLLNDAHHLESLEVSWCPIFFVKECLPRFACLSLYYTIDMWKFEYDQPVPPECYDQPLQRNVCRLRGAMRRLVLDSRTGSSTDASAALTASDVTELGRRKPFERDGTWTAWLSDATLMEQVAIAFNSCPWALHDDVPPNPASPDDANRIREDWPVAPYVKEGAEKQ